jgi:hypothetical protein
MQVDGCLKFIHKLSPLTVFYSQAHRLSLEYNFTWYGKDTMPSIHFTPAFQYLQKTFPVFPSGL